MRLKILTVATLVASVAIPLASSAATYNYVNASGNISAVNADDANQALTVSDIASTSGVMLDNGTVNMSGFIPVSGYGTASVSTDTSAPTTSGVLNTSTTLNTYEYIDNNGNVAYVQAANSDQAMALVANNISSSSGLLLVQ